MSKEKADHLAKFMNDDKGQKHYLSLSYQFIRTFLNTIDPNSEASYYVCHELEDSLLKDGRFLDGIPSRQTYLENLRRINQQRAPLEKQREDIDSERVRLRTQRRRTDLTDEERADIETQLADKERALQGLAADLDALKRPDNRKIYPTSGAAFEAKQEKGKLQAREQDWKYIFDWLDSKTGELATEEATPLFRNLTLLFNILKGSEQQQSSGSKDWALEERALTFLLVHSKENTLKNFVSKFANENQQAYNYLMAKMIGANEESDIANLFSEQSPLVQYGLITPPTAAGIPTISDFLVKLLSKHDLTEEALRAELSGKPLTTDLEWEKDFHGLGEKGQRLEQLIRHSMAEKTAGKKHKGPVFFFTGPPDTGKTSAVAALAKHLGLNVRVIGETVQKVRKKDGSDSKVEPLTPMDRLSQILMSLAVAGNDPKTLFLVEEPDTFLPLNRMGDGREIKDPVDRVIVQRLFEDNPATALMFTTNHWPEIHPAVRRRAAMQVNIDTPNRYQRAEIIKNIIAAYNRKAEETGVAPVALAEADIQSLAANYKAPAGKWASAIPNAIITASGDPARLKDEITFFIEAQAERDYGSASVIKASHIPSEYDFKLANATIRGGTSLEELREAITKDVEGGSKKFRLLLDGWPGTGKSEFVWHLAEKLNKDVMYVKASDLLSMWVGGTEQNIAHYFEQARQSGAILLIDEVDSILSSRDNAQHSWEVTQVNEFLTQLEHYDGMIAVTTNHADNVDPAAFRRFKRRINFDFLTEKQCAYAYEKFFGEPPNEMVSHRLGRLENLSPADFVLVKEDAEFFGFKDQPTKIVAALEEISSQKPKEHKAKWNRRPIGFGSGAAHDGVAPVGEHTRKALESKGTANKGRED
jgi:SpoVK/Ycf46/Vps4 family AAA+-type ATPase